MQSNVAIYKQAKARYSENPPYFPAAIFPEYPFSDTMTDRGNEAYGSIRKLLLLMGLDAENFGKRLWNPFGAFVFPGNIVLLKPNFMRHFNERGGTGGLITHGSVIRVAADYAYIALKGKGRIIIADGPMDDADFEKIAGLTGLYEIKKFYKDSVNFDIEIYDLRQEMVEKKGGKIIHRERLSGDPLGYKVVDLGGVSEFKKGKLDYKSFRGSECKVEVMNSHHNEERDEYLISSTFLSADVVINIPKMKTHKRAGVTLGLKNMVGITGDRNWLPHSSEPVSVNNKNKASFKARVKKYLINIISLIRPLRDRMRQIAGVTEATIYAGNWHGNDIMWRTILDLGRIKGYADRAGRISKDRQRRSFVIVDGIVGGEADGPTNPTPKPCGVLVAGFDELTVDVTTSRIMGFDPMKIPKFKNINAVLPSIKCASNVDGWTGAIADFKGRCLNFKPHYGWKGHIEVED